VSWLAKLEQGHAHAVSPEVLASLARALGLSDAEHTHLFALAGYLRNGDSLSAVTVTDSLRTLLKLLEPHPAYLLDRCWNIVAWNQGEERLFPKLTTFTDNAPNLLELVFLDHDLADLMADHNEEKVRLVDQFRLQCSDWPNDPEIAAVVGKLCRTCTDFADLWWANEVSPYLSTRRVFNHPTAGRLELDHHRLAVLEQPGLQLIVYIPPT
jgi:hypothetical protein